MNTGSGLPSNAQRPGQSVWPSTPLGRWSVSLGATFVVLMLINGLVFMRLPEQVGWRQTILPVYGIAMMLCGLASGIVALVAIRRQNERSWLVRAPLFAAGFVVIFLLGEFLGPKH